jgi:hypothetical protein
MYDFLMKEMHFSQQITNIGTSRFVTNQKLPVIPIEKFQLLATQEGPPSDKIYGF